jgi:ArsR family transcriptional regulator, virulence genes transcriptional regulator
METRVIYAFSNPIRLRLLCCLSKKSSNVSELINNCGLAQSAVSQHLSKLKSAGLIKTNRRGKYIYYSLINKKTGELAMEMNNYVKEVCK